MSRLQPARRRREAPRGQEERFHSTQERLRKAISLGLRPSSQPDIEKRKRWWNTDAEVQGQAVRAISAFVTALKSSGTTLTVVHKPLVEDMIAALEGLLAAESEQIYIAAADAAAELLSVGGGWFLNYGGKELVEPLVRLVSCPKGGPAASSAIALRIILESFKPRSSSGEDNLWRLLKEGDVLGILTTRLQKQGALDCKGGPFYVAFADLLIFILKRWPMSRFSVARIDSFRAMLSLQCKNSNDAISCAALKVCTALALCGGATMLQLKDAEATWSCISHCLQKSQKFSVQLEALRFFASLNRIPDLSISASRSHLGTICESILEAIAKGSCIHKDRWPPDVEIMVLEASYAARGFLFWPGQHHMLFWKIGIVKVLCNLLMHNNDMKKDQLQKADLVDFDRKAGKNDRLLGPILWDIIGWLAAHAGSFVDDFLSANNGQEVACSRLLIFACDMLLKVVNRRGQSQSPTLGTHSPADISYAGSEGVAICKVVLKLLSTQSKYLAIRTSHYLEEALQHHGSDWLQSLVNKLGVRFSSSATSDDPIILTNLIAVASLSYLSVCRKQLLQGMVLEVLTEAIRAHAVRLVGWEPTWPKRSFAASLSQNTCCVNNSTWEGHDSILFYSLWAFSKLVHGSELAKILFKKIKSRLSGDLDCNGSPDGEVESCLLRLVCDTGAATGLRWWASYSLACCGFYGFPILGMDLKRVFNESASADLALVFADGSQLHAHKVALAIKCPALLPKELHAEASEYGKLCIPSAEAKTEGCSITSEQGGSVPAYLHLSGRLHWAAVKAILEFIYNGFALIDDEMVAEVKLLAKRCHLESFLKLLQGKAPGWEPFPAQCDFTSALGSVGCTFSDIVLQAKDDVQVSCSMCMLDKSHVHAHRVFLSSRCSYFEALFRSGMQDSALKSMKIPLSLESLNKLLVYLYSGNLPSLSLPEAGCMWSSSSKEEQVQYLESYVELAHLAEQWLLNELQEQCLSVVQRQLKWNWHLAPEVMKCAALREQWKFVEAAADCVAPNYPQMRDRGELDDLEDYLMDLVRAAYVKISMNSGE